MDRRTKILTTAVLSVCAITILCFNLPIWPSKVQHFAYAFPMSVVIGRALFSSATGYELSDDKLTIITRVKNNSIARDDIHSFASHVPTGRLLKMLRFGGLFGYYGVYPGSESGKVTMYATRKDNMIIIQLRSGEKCALSPDDTEGFLAALQRQSK